MQEAHQECSKIRRALFSLGRGNVRSLMGQLAAFLGAQALAEGVRRYDRLSGGIWINSDCSCCRRRNAPPSVYLSPIWPL